MTPTQTTPAAPQAPAGREPQVSRTTVHHPTEAQQKKWTYHEDKSWSCSCGADIEAVTQYRSVHLSDGPGLFAGTGEVEHHIIPYCPKCDPKPSDRGVTRKTIMQDVMDNLY